ncbi:hypothetical protein RFI_38149, partial [Reticulomyxa filosa]
LTEGSSILFKIALRKNQMLTKICCKAEKISFIFKALIFCCVQLYKLVFVNCLSEYICLNITFYNFKLKATCNSIPFFFVTWSVGKEDKQRKKKGKTKQSNKIKAVPQIETSPLVNIQIKTTQQNITFLNIQQSRESNSKLGIFNISITKEKKR